MRAHHQVALSLLFSLVIGLSIGCSNKDKAGKGGAGAAQQTLPDFVDHIPADSPYVFAMAKSFPDVYLDKFWAAASPLLKEAEMEFVKNLEQEAKGGGENAKLAQNLLTEFRGKFSREGLESLGLSSRPRIAVYGLGPFPVLRVVLQDAKALQDVLTRLEKNSSLFPRSALLGQQRYWSFNDNEATVIVAIVQTDLVVAVVPAKSAASFLPQVLGQQKPKTSVRTVARFKELMTGPTFLPFGVGYVDAKQLVDGILGDAQGPSSKSWAEVDIDRTAFSPICKAEFKALTQYGSRLEFGFTQFDKKGQKTVGHLYSDPKLTKIFSQATTKTPGLGLNDASLIDLGLGLNVKTLLDGVKERLLSLSQAPFQCPLLIEANMQATQVNAGLMMAEGQVPPAVLTIGGFHIRVTAGNFQSSTPDDLAGTIVISADKPLETVTFLKGLIPSLANVPVKPGAQPVKLSGLPMVPPSAQPAMALTDSAIGFSFGEGTSESLPKVLGGKAASPTPFLTYGYNLKALSSQAKGTLYANTDKDIAEAVMALGGTFTMVRFSAHAEKDRFVFESVLTAK